MLCPRFSLCSVLFWISTLQIIFYITSLILGGIDKKSFLAVNPKVLEDMG